MVDFEDSNENLGKKIRGWKVAKSPYAVILGDKEIESGMLAIETRSGEKLSESAEAFVARISEEIKTRAL